MACEVPLSPLEDSGNVDSTLAFDEANNLRDTILWRNGDQHVDMVCHEVAFQYFALFLLSKRPEHLPQILPELSV